ncbi:hypothetical protein C2E21_0700 [Chlorella sorokiniana]|uniref:Uncharacterized protein n=1 Tax=Chlorella sorokiniana TaxID=3076 RepID=A0A2P6U2J4_CHLSO|nr:hypothetical protein C2E21_0700 [Chlorella sorokiniana]|eukprot:PRW60520.1 hypothetical protein C2E21_0700 [Chlorella sorokiniana]
MLAPALSAQRAPAPFVAAPRQQQRRVRASVRAQAADEQPAASSAEQQQPQQPAAAKGGCPTCGAADIAFGCDGSGRIVGGIGAVPGFGWWPIKAYRPCPKASQAGVQYQRKGQITDEVLFGRGRQ